MQASSTHPLLLLQEIDNACRKIIGNNVAPIQENNTVWSGVSFRVEDCELLIKNTYIDEITNTHFQHNLSTMPGAKTWFLGLTSLRGQPLSVIDLKQYLFNQASTITPLGRLIVIKHEDTTVGLLVEHVYGLKQFNANAAQENTDKDMHFSENIKPLIDTHFIEQDIIWGNLSIPRLFNEQNFANAAR